MSNKKKSAASDHQLAVRDQRSEQGEAEPTALYEVRDWKGKELCVCPLCGFDTLAKIKMLRHLVGKHNSELALVALVDLEKDSPSPLPPLPDGRGEEQPGDVFEVELVETGSTMDAQGNEQKTFTVKEN